ncbi:uncharacterized protein [Arachis hypogaea]|uniref:uncharacterized protein n=1 Tax=Arachis hypogaea TaxID=3818 RepID=UPI003B214809
MSSSCKWLSMESPCCPSMEPRILPNPSVSIPVLQGAVQQSYHFKPSYRKMWMVKQKAISQIYGDWKESYNKVPKLLQAQQSCFPGTICELQITPYYDGHRLWWAQDGNNNILPIAFAIVESESTES